MLLLHPKQLDVVRSPARFKTVRAGRRSGKTILKAETMLIKAISKNSRKNRSLIYIAPTQKQARTIIWEHFKSRIGKVADYNESRLEIKIPNQDGGKSTIFIGGWENRENYRGMPNVIHLEFDEVDTMKEFFIGWQEIFRPMLIDTQGSAGFGGTPQKETPNLRRLEKEPDADTSWQSFHFTTADNPHITADEIKKARDSMDADTYKQEILAEYIDNAGSLFHYDALVDIFSNTIVKDSQLYLIVDVADDGSDKTVFSFWEGLEEYKRDEFARLNTEGIIAKIREYASYHRIPYSNIAVDAIGVGAAVASSSLLDGIIGFKSSYAPIKTDLSPVLLPNVGYRKGAPLVSDYKNLRSQCIFTLADHVNNRKIASKVTGHQKECIIEELQNYQEVGLVEGKRMATGKDKVKEIIGHSPDASDTFIMRMYFVVRAKAIKDQDPYMAEVIKAQTLNFHMTKSKQDSNSTK